MNIGCISVGGMVNNVKTFASINISNLIEPQEKPLLISEVYYLDIPTTQKPDKKYTTN